MENHHHYDDAPRFTWNEMTAAVGGEWLLAPTAEMAQHVVDDSRRVAQGDLFVAIVGELADGHRYVTRAAEAGAAAVLVERQPDDDAMLRLGELGCGCLLVPDSLSALMALAGRRFSARRATPTTSSACRAICFVWTRAAAPPSLRWAATIPARSAVWQP